MCKEKRLAFTVYYGNPSVNLSLELRRENEDSSAVTSLLCQPCPNLIQFFCL